METLGELQQVVELHAQAAADAAEMRTAPLQAVADAVRVLAAGAAVGAKVGVDL